MQWPGPGRHSAEPAVAQWKKAKPIGLSNNQTSFSNFGSDSNLGPMLSCFCRACQSCQPYYHLEIKFPCPMSHSCGWFSAEKRVTATFLLFLFVCESGKRVRKIRRILSPRYVDGKTKKKSCKSAETQKGNGNWKRAPYLSDKLHATSSLDLRGITVPSGRA